MYRIGYIDDQPVQYNNFRKKIQRRFVLACPKCNLVKSGKWPTEDKNIMHDEEKGFIDPATEEYDKHIERTEEGFIQGKLYLEGICVRTLIFILEERIYIGKYIFFIRFRKNWNNYMMRRN